MVTIKQTIDYSPQGRLLEDPGKAFARKVGRMAGRYIWVAVHVYGLLSKSSNWLNSHIIPRLQSFVFCPCLHNIGEYVFGQYLKHLQYFRKPIFAIVWYLY